MFEGLCATVSPVFGHAELTSEYDAKNLSFDGQCLMAVGIDVSRALPGIYWRNFYGRSITERISRERLLTAPATEVREVDGGILLALAEDPTTWNTPEYRLLERQVLNHIGPQFFFSRDDPDRQTVPPVEGLPDLPPTPPLGVIVKLDQGGWARL
jgi:hypothetical protein